MKILKKSFWFAPFIGVHWLKAQTQSNKREYEGSLKRLDKIVKLSSSDAQPLGGIYAEYAVLRGHVLHALGKKEQAVKAFESGLRAARHSANYNEDEKDYLQAYASIEHADISPPLKQVSAEMLEDIYLSGVRMDIKLCLPLFSHPNWPNPDEMGIVLDDESEEDSIKKF
jgi:tetratricopeptide (TPR) repeat protein